MRKQFIKEIQTVLNNGTWEYFLDTKFLHFKPDADNALTYLNSRRTSFNTTAMVLSDYYDKALNSALNLEIDTTKRRFIYFVAKFIANEVAYRKIKRFLRVAGMDKRTNSKINVVWSFSKQNVKFELIESE